MKATEAVVEVYNKVTGVPRQFTLTQWAMLPKVARLEWQQGTPPEAASVAVAAPAAAMIQPTLDQQIAKGVADALKALGITVPEPETAEQKQARQIKEGVAASLRAMGMSDEAIAKVQGEVSGENPDAGKVVDAPVQTADATVTKAIADAAADTAVKSTGTTTVDLGTDAAKQIDAVRDPVVVAQAAVAADGQQAVQDATNAVIDTAEEGSVDNAVGEEDELAKARKRFEELYPGQQAGRKQLDTLLQAIKAKETDGN